MKTIREWLNELPEPYRTQALANAIDLDCTAESMKEALISSFIWHESPEGVSHWKSVFKELCGISRQESTQDKIATVIQSGHISGKSSYDIAGGVLELIQEARK